MVFCSNCGTNLGASARFCSSCGTACGGGGGGAAAAPRSGGGGGGAAAPRSGGGGGGGGAVKSGFAGVYSSTPQSQGYTPKAETCPGCNRTIAPGQNRGEQEKIVVGGKEWHKDCYSTKSRGGEYVTEPRSHFHQTSENCPGCGGSVAPGMNRGDREKIIVQGKEWHKDCYSSKSSGGEYVTEPRSHFHQSVENCPGCHTSVAPGMNKGDREKIIVQGKEWHRDCYERRGNLSLESNPRAIFQQQAARCPGCGRDVYQGMNVGECEKIIVRGEEWHRDCYRP